MPAPFLHILRQAIVLPPLLDAFTIEDYNGNMAQVSVTLSSDLQRHVDARVADGGFGDPAAYLRVLAERDRDAYRADVTRVQAMIDEGFASGVCNEDARAVLDRIIADVRGPHG